MTRGTQRMPTTCPLALPGELPFYGGLVGFVVIALLAGSMWRGFGRLRSGLRQASLADASYGGRHARSS